MPVANGRNVPEPATEANWTRRQLLGDRHANRKNRGEGTKRTQQDGTAQTNQSGRFR